MTQFQTHSERADRLYSVAQRIGFALWQLQELEGVCATYFVLLAEAKPGSRLAAGNRRGAKAKNRTIGTTLRKLRKRKLLDRRLATRLKAILQERNWLVHRSGADGRAAVHSDGNTTQLVARVDSVAEESLALLKEVCRRVERFAKKHGVAEEYTFRTASELLRQWHRADV